MKTSAKPQLNQEVTHQCFGKHAAKHSQFGQQQLRAKMGGDLCDISVRNDLQDAGDQMLTFAFRRQIV